MTKKLQQKPLTNMELAEFCNQMSMVLRSGISPLEGLNLLLDEAQSEGERVLLQKIISEMEMTGFLHEAVASSGVFPNYALFMIKLGEETGTLDEVMESLANHYTREANMAEMIKNSFVYPSIMVVMMALVIGVLLTKVMPIFNQVFLQLGQEMTGFSAGLLKMGETLSSHSILVLGFAIVLILCGFYFRKHLPFYKKIQTQIAACRFADGMSIILKSGMTPEQGLELVSNLVENNEYEKKISDCDTLLNEGMDFSAALHASNLFAGTYARMASIAGKSGTMDEAMAKIADEYEYHTTLKINRMIATIEPTLVIALSIVVGMILFSVMLPLLGIMSGL